MPFGFLHMITGSELPVPKYHRWTSVIASLNRQSPSLNFTPSSVYPGGYLRPNPSHAVTASAAAPTKKIVIILVIVRPASFHWCKAYQVRERVTTRNPHR